MYHDIESQITTRQDTESSRKGYRIKSSSLFSLFPYFQIQNTIPDGYKKDLTYTNVDNAESCAKICMQRKHCTCTSFSFNEKRKKCIISDR